MAYQNDPKRDASILAQVAFYGTVTLTNGQNYDINTEDGQAYFEQAQAYLHNSLLNAVKSAQGGTAAQAAASSPAISDSAAEQALKEAFAGTTEQWDNQGIEVFRGLQQGPLPQWLIDQAKADGVTKVFDNRKDAQGTKRPWFKQVGGGDNAKAYWPPKD